MAEDDVLHCRPMRKANRRTGAVYCPSELYDGWVTTDNHSDLSGEETERAAHISGTDMQIARKAFQQHTLPRSKLPFGVNPGRGKPRRN